MDDQRAGAGSAATEVMAAARAASGSMQESRKGIRIVGGGGKVSADLPVSGGGKSIPSAVVAADASRLRSQREDRELRQRASSLMQVRAGLRSRSGSGSRS